MTTQEIESIIEGNKWVFLTDLCVGNDTNVVGKLYRKKSSTHKEITWQLSLSNHNNMIVIKITSTSSLPSSRFRGFIECAEDLQTIERLLRIK